MKTTGKNSLRLGILALIISCSVTSAFTTHIVGGDVSYRCLGGNLYEISLTLRRDCQNGQANFDSPAALGIFDANGILLTNLANNGVLRMAFRSDDTLNEILDTRCGLIGGNVCVHTTTYRETIELPFRTGGYVLVYQRCCRNFTIGNIIDPLTVGATYSVDIKEEALRFCNSSPDLGNYPPIFICGGTPLDFDLHAVDQDGDSLVYSLCTPHSGASQSIPMPSPPSGPPFLLVPFKPPYSLNDVMGGNPKLTMNSITGNMKGFAVDIVAQYLVAYCVREYRKGILLTELYRDFQINVRQCTSVPTAAFSANISNCTDPITIKLQDQSTDLFSSIENWNWMLTVDSLKFNSMSQHPSFNLPDSGLAKVQLIVTSKDGCSDTIIDFFAFKTLKPDFINHQLKICKGDSTFLLNSFDSSLQYNWSPSIGLSCTQCPNPKAGPRSNIIYKVTTSNDTCHRLDSIELLVENCFIDSCAVTISTTCLPSGMIELTALDAFGSPIVPRSRIQELYWDLESNSTSPGYSLVNKNPVYLKTNTHYTLTSKLYSWKIGVPKTIEFAQICHRRITDSVAITCQGPCSEFNLILSSCEDDYDKNYQLNYPNHLCNSICQDECDYIIGLFEENGNLINPTEYQIKWSSGHTGAYVFRMGPYFDNLKVEVRKGDCVWYGRYVKSCTQFVGNILDNTLSDRARNISLHGRNLLKELSLQNIPFSVFSSNGQLILKKNDDWNYLTSGIYIVSYMRDGELNKLKIWVD
ncbi:MAG: hypothetical protein M3Q56_10130 [Bacteroidota bacterium]|nr:hypothetical protein [Bacteroidota bacterium]